MQFLSRTRDRILDEFTSAVSQNSTFVEQKLLIDTGNTRLRYDDVSLAIDERASYRPTERSLDLGPRDLSRAQQRIAITLRSFAQTDERIAAGNIRRAQ